MSCCRDIREALRRLSVKNPLTLDLWILNLNLICFKNDSLGVLVGRRGACIIVTTSVANG